MKCELLIPSRSKYISVIANLIGLFLVLVLLNETEIIRFEHATFRVFNFLITILVYIPLFFIGWKQIHYKNIGNVILNSGIVTIQPLKEGNREIEINPKTRIRINSEEKVDRIFRKYWFVKISIEDERNNSETIFLIINEKQKNELKEIMSFWYKEKYDLKETMNEWSKAFLFQTNLSYKEIQEIKTKYDLVW